MEEKTLNLSKSVYELCNQFPELPEILSQIGFPDIVKPGMLATAGRFMTIPKGATIKRLDIEIIQEKLRENGYQVNP